MKNIKKLFVSALGFIPLSILTLTPNKIVRNNKIANYSKKEDDIVFFVPEKKGFISLPKTFKYCEELFEIKTLRAFPLWCFVERIDSFDGKHYFKDYANDLSKLLDIEYTDIVPNNEEANFINVVGFINKTITEIENKLIKTEKVDFIMKDYIDDISGYYSSKEQFFNNIKKYLLKMKNDITSQLNRFVDKYREIVLEDKRNYLNKLKEELNWIKDLLAKLKDKAEHSGTKDWWERNWNEYRYYEAEERKLEEQIKKEYEKRDEIKIIEYKII